MKLALLLTGDTGAPGLAGDAVLDFAIDTELAQGITIQGNATFGIPPSPADNLPRIWHKATGRACEVFPVSYTPDGLVNWVHVSGPIVHTTAFSVAGAPFGTDTWTADEPATPLPSQFARWSGPDVTQLVVRLVTAAGIPLTAAFTTTPHETFILGSTMREDRHFARLTGPSGQKGPGVQLILRKRGDYAAAEMFITLENNLYEPKAGNLWSADADVCGEIWFNSWEFAQLPAGTQIVAAEGDRPSQNTTLWKIVKEQGINAQILPAGQSIAESYVIYDNTLVTAAQARAIGRMAGAAGAVGGELAAHKRPGWGAQGVHLPDFSSSQRSFSGQTGRAAFLQYEQSVFDVLSTARSTGGVAGGGNQFAEAAVGWWHPYGTKAPGGGSGEEILFRQTGSLCGKGWRHNRIQAHHIQQRHPSGIVNPVTGAEVMPEDLAALAPDGKMPWAMTWRTQAKTEISAWCPHFLRAGGLADGTLDGTTSARYLGPENRPWNALPTNRLNPNWKDQRCLEYFNSGSAGWIPFEGDHHGRYFHCFEALAWGQNYGFAKWLLRREAIHFQRSATRFLISTSAPANFNNPFFANGFSMPTIEALVISAGKQEWGGVGVPNTSMSRQRGWGMTGVVVGDGYRFMVPGSAQRTNARLWGSAYALDLATICTPYGMGERFDPDATGDSWNTSTPGSTAQLLYPNAWVVWGDTDEPGQQGALPAEDTPGYTGQKWSCAQGFQSAYLANGAAAVSLAMFEPVDTERAQLARCTTEFLRAMWEDARVPGQPAPPAYLICAKGTLGNNQAPLANPVRWLFEAQSGWTQFQDILDYRAWQALAFSLNLAREEGNASHRAKCVQWAKDYWGASTVQVAINQLWGFANGAASGGSQRWIEDWSLDLIGELQQEL